jgi:hypothetical protein
MFAGEVMSMGSSGGGGGGGLGSGTNHVTTEIYSINSLSPAGGISSSLLVCSGFRM